METPALCLHKETTSRLCDEQSPFNQPWGEQIFIADWMPTEDFAWFGMASYALECRINYKAIQNKDTSTNNEVVQDILMITHTPKRHARPLANQRGNSRISRECRLQEGFSFDPTHYLFHQDKNWSALRCYEGRLKNRFAKRAILAYLSGGDSAVFAVLQTIWFELYGEEYRKFLKLQKSTLKGNYSEL